MTNTVLTVRLPEPLEEALDAYCAEHGLTKSHVVQESLATYLVQAQAAPEHRSAPRVSANFAAFKRAGLIGCVAVGGGATKEAVRARAAERVAHPRGGSRAR